ncbi:GNAT family N-acetyltransferase [Emticicia sp. C21]|uniref:GNAT family N-acetyltransferase n=1 Tax=Emticicia sp. C21 TaxID=2302915 RepID=UPI000E34777B|nr:GNAT family N-acetyltransferase [Emticicia sp. C21]RFS16948.1 GNAT family N-acetyltransferase [Emticicia sp. C21]
MDLEEFLKNFKLIRLSEDHVLKPFNCGNVDLNDFFLNDSKAYQKQLLAVTYIIESDDETVAFFSLLNDKIVFETAKDGRKNFWNLLNRSIPNSKRTYSGYPAMKIGRLGVSSNFQGRDIGTLIIDYLKDLFITNNRTGCKFITVDAYKQSLNFYIRNGFQFLTDKDEDDETRLMYFNLSAML